MLDSMLVPVFFDSGSAEAKAALEDMLRTLLEDRRLVVESYHADHVLTDTGRDSVRVDVSARDGDDRRLALVLQPVADEEVYPRAVFEAATMIVRSLPAGHPYSDLERVVAIFVTPQDLEEQGEAAYRYQATRADNTEKIMPAAPEYIFLNGTFRDKKTKIGRIIADIMEPDPERMRTPLLRRRMNFLKNTEEGRKKLEAALEQYLQERDQRQARERLFKLVGDGKLTAVEAAAEAGMSEEDFSSAMQAHASQSGAEV